MTSTELIQQPDLLTGPSYPMDFITDSHQCHLMTQWDQLKVKAAVGSVFPPSPGATFHCRPIPQGYAVVMVDEITEGFEELQLDHPTGDGETQLGLAMHTLCLWWKEHMKLLNITAPASYIVDFITESQNCHLMTQ